MDAKEILNPQRLMIAVGVLVIVVSFWGIMNGDKWAEYGKKMNLLMMKTTRKCGLYT